MSDNIAIGIDLGTTFSCVAVCRNGGVHTCIDETGKNTIPSYVCFTEKDRLVGSVAKQLSMHHIQSTIYDAKRLIGREFDDPAYREDEKYWPFNIIEEKGRLKIQIQVHTDVENKYELKSFFPEEISKMILVVLKKNAESYLGHDVKNAVITVPAYFNDAQRQATMCAASLAGLTVLKIVNEPTAAAFAYGYNVLDGKEHHLLVFDLGGGTFDVSILRVYNGNVKVFATGGDNHLGGDDFDNLLVDYCIKNHFKEKIDREKNDGKKALIRLRNQCEMAKITLSTANEASIIIESLYNGKDIHVKIPKARFESLNKKIFDKCMDIVEECLKASKIDPVKLELVLVGGSTRIPKIRTMLQDKYPNMTLNKSLNPDEAIAHGAAILAHMAMEAKSKEIHDDSLRDITPLSLGVESKGGAMSVMIPKFSEFPIKKSNVYSTTKDNQEVMLIKVYEGERTMVEDNYLLGEFEIKDIPAAPKGHVKVEVTFEIDANSVLIVTAVEKVMKTTQCITISNCKNKLSQEDIERIYKDEEKYKLQDKRKKDAIVAKNNSITYFENLKIQLTSLNCKTKLSNDQMIELNKKLDDAIDYVEFNAIEDVNVYNEKRQELESCYATYMRL